MQWNAIRCHASMRVTLHRIPLTKARAFVRPWCRQSDFRTSECARLSLPCFTAGHLQPPAEWLWHECHVKLLELFDRQLLPSFPPKEPLWQKIFGGDGARADWMEERYGRLFGYLVGLLEIPGALQTEALLEFLNAPAGTVEPSSSSTIALIRSVRVRLTGDPGAVEVVVRADAPAPCSVRLALRPLPGGDVEEWESKALPSLEQSSDHAWERLLELDLDPSKSQELVHRFDLEPGSLWQVAAVGVALDTTTGSPVCIQIRAPTAQELDSLTPPPETQAHAGSADDRRREEDKKGADPAEPGPEAEAQAEAKDPGEASSTATQATGPDEEVKSSEAVSEEEEIITEEGKTIRRKRQEALPESKVISFQGSAALEYARRIEEKQRLEAARAPHRWEAHNGTRRSVPVHRLETKSASGAAERQHYGTMEVLDHSIQAHQEQQLRDDELQVAAWIYAVTGDSGSKAAAAGQGTLQDALQSGEVLCDLINAIWPNRIVGISRGAAAQLLFRRVANITQFVQACSKEGMSNSVFVPGDLAEGKNFRSVVRCLCALAHQVPDTWEGPRLCRETAGRQGSPDRSASRK
ncbi:unnamed protein product [Effrenium voratum]|nr:unnamed protein product [Effrenium voratum]